MGKGADQKMLTEWNKIASTTWWAEYNKRLSKRRQYFSNNNDKVKSEEEWRRGQGNVEAFDWVFKLPSDIQKEMAGKLKEAPPDL
jgi:hypothetical protein